MDVTAVAGEGPGDAYIDEVADNKLINYAGGHGDVGQPIASGISTVPLIVVVIEPVIATLPFVIDPPHQVQIDGSVFLHKEDVVVVIVVHG